MLFVSRVESASGQAHAGPATERVPDESDTGLVDERRPFWVLSTSPRANDTSRERSQSASGRPRFDRRPMCRDARWRAPQTRRSPASPITSPCENRVPQLPCDTTMSGSLGPVRNGLRIAGNRNCSQRRPYGWKLSTFAPGCRLEPNLTHELARAGVLSSISIEAVPTGLPHRLPRWRTRPPSAGSPDQQQARLFQWLRPLCATHRWGREIVAGIMAAERLPD